MNEIMGPKQDRKAIRFYTSVPMRYLVKISHGEIQEAKDAVVTSMSAAGVRFETEEQLGVGKILTVEINLQDDVIVRATGEVGRVTPIQKEEGKCYEIALSFTEISNTAKEKINMWYYSEKFSPTAKTQDMRAMERRKSERFNISKSFAEFRQKRLLAKKPWQQADIKQVSKHGIILASRIPLEAGEMLETIIHLPAYKEPIKALCRVVRTKKEGFGSSIALEFVKIKPKDVKKFSGSIYIKESVDKSYKKFT